MDLTQFEYDPQAPVLMTVRHPSTDDDLTDEGTGQPVTITLLGRDSAEFKKAIRTASNKRLETMATTGRRPKISLDELEKDGMTLAIAATKAWSGIKVDGQFLECNPENAQSLYTRFPWIKEQVEAFISNRANFLKNS